jgi:NitT/TauT family transport system substrate-binding protein
VKRFKAKTFAALIAAFTAIGFVPAEADEVIRIGGVANYGPVIPVIAAQELKLFDKAGVEVQFTNFNGGSASMEGLAAGEVDLINFFPPGHALASRRGVKATIVSAGTLTPRGWHIVVGKDSKISSLKDLAGKKIGVTSNGSTTDFFALWAASQAGGEITRVPLGGAGLVPNLISGNVDAIVAYPPLSYKVLGAGDGKSLVHLGEAMTPNLPDVWIASDEIIAKNPDGLEKALVGLYSAIVYMQNNPEWSIDFIAKKTGLAKEIATEEYNNTIKGLSSDGNLKEEWVAESLKLGTLAGIKDLPSAASMYTPKFVPVKTIAP